MADKKAGEANKEKAKKPRPHGAPTDATPTRARAKKQAAKLKPNRKPAIDTTWHAPFIAALAKCGNVSYACRLANVERRLTYEHRERFPEFAEAWDTACIEAVEGLEFAAHQRALSESDSLIMFLLCALKPEKYRDKRKVEFTGQLTIAMQNEIEKLLKHLETALSALEFEHVCAAIESMAEGG